MDLTPVTRTSKAKKVAKNPQLWMALAILVEAALLALK